MSCLLFLWAALLSPARTSRWEGTQRTQKSTVFPAGEMVTRLLVSFYMQGSVLGAGAALHRLFFLFGPGLGLSSGAESLACETELGTSTRSSTAIKKPPVSVVSGEARRQCSAPGKVLRPRWGHEGRTGASLKVPELCCRASWTTSSFSSWQREHVE